MRKPEINASFRCTGAWTPACLALAILAASLRSSPVFAEKTTGASTTIRPIDLTNLARLEVSPKTVHLFGKDSRQQLLVTGLMPAGATRDVTRSIRYASADPKVAVVSSAGVVSPVGSGSTRMVLSTPSQTIDVPVVVSEGENYLPLDFVNDIVPILTRHGCNGGGCHGKSNGRGGFALSLFGYDPQFDYDDMVRGSRGRRIFPAAPENSLLLLKPTTTVPHAGGKRLEVGHADYERLKRWIATGSPWGRDEAPRLTAIEIEPAFRSLETNVEQQVAVTAIFSDGSRRDVTETAEFRCNDPAIATVDENGLITSRRTGETAVIALYQGQVAVSRVMMPLEAKIAQWPAFPIGNFIDPHILGKLRQLNVPPSAVIDDARFLRRASLQITGRLPQADEVEAFVAESDPSKRASLVDRLLESGAYADHFAQKWSDILRNRRRNQKDRMDGTIGFHRWIRNALAENMPYDRFVRQIVTAAGNPDVNPPAQWYAEVRYLDRYVDDSAQAFLGLRIGCARCHHHPFESFSQEDYYGLAAFFARVGRKGGIGIEERRADETIFVKADGEVKHPVTGEVVPPHGLGAAPAKIASYEDPREHFVDWMVQADNPYFARAFVNRMWAHFFGRGLVEPLDDMRVTNPASNEPFLNELAGEFCKSGYDMRHVIRLICQSTTYQLSAEANAYNLEETQCHSRFYPQRLTAEVLLDAMDSVTQNATRFGGLPAGTRAVQLPDEDYSNQFLRVFGRPLRESACECERVAEPSLSQSLFLLNDRFILDKVFTNASLSAKLAQEKAPDKEKLTKLFLTVFSRKPTAAELAKATRYLQSEKDQKQAYGNLLWALTCTKEFLYVH